MAAPRRTAARRTAEAIAEDLKRARSVGGLQRAGANDLVATVDCLELRGGVPAEELVQRARDLLHGHVLRGCERCRNGQQDDRTALAAADALQTLLTRESSDRRLAQRVRELAAAAVGHLISPDAVRHREDRLIGDIAAEALADLQDEPQSLEAAIRRLVPMALDIRQQLHDGLCLIYECGQQADPREARAIDGFYRQVVIKLGELLTASRQLAVVGMSSPNMTASDFWFVSRAQHINRYAFDESDDRQFIVDFLRQESSPDWEETVERLLALERGRELFNRWLAWVRSCYPTCAFEALHNAGCSRGLKPPVSSRDLAM